jgi:hypothetical protein
MKGLVLSIITIISICVSMSAQKLTEPKYLGGWIAGEDSSEFLYHRVLETSLELLKENPDGKLIVRICSSDEFSDAFVKSSLNPLTIANYGFYQVLTPERVFVARSKNCLFEKKFLQSQYWFVADKIDLEYDEIYSARSIYYKDFEIYEFDAKDRRKLKREFDENLEKFISELKNNPQAEGFIVHNSTNRKMKRHIEKVQSLLRNQSVNLGRIKTVIKVQLEPIESGKLMSVKDKNSFPTLAVIEIKK